MAPPRNSLLASLTGLGAAIITAPPSLAATWLDQDPLCQTYGCVIIHDGNSYAVYDVFDIQAGAEVPSGAPLIRRLTGGPPDSIGEVHPVITGTTTEALTTAPLEDQGAMLSIDTDGDGIGDLIPVDANNSGFLDAADTLPSFELTDATSIVGSSTSYQRSFYFTSTTDFYLTASVAQGPAGQGISLTNGLQSIGFTYRIQRGGNDDGLRFGQRAQKGNTTRLVGNVTTLQDLAAGPVTLLDVRRELAKRNADTIAEQSLRFDYVYDFGGYDLAMGNGDLNFQIEFDVQRR